jgi:hypothetical protein
MVRGNYFVNNLPTWRSHHVGFPLLPCAFGQEAHAHIYDAVAEDFSRTWNLRDIPFAVWSVSVFVMEECQYGGTPGALGTMRRRNHRPE